MAIKDVNGNQVFYISKEEQEKFDKARAIKENARDYPADWIYTIGYFGAKKSARVEYELLYKYVCNKYNVKVLADAFGGSGSLSLLAAKTCLFSEIFLNELSYFTINFHYVMKNDNPRKRDGTIAVDTSIDWILKWMQNMKAKNQNIDISKYERKRDLFEEFIFYLANISEFHFKRIKSHFKNYTYRRKVITKKYKNGKAKEFQVWVPKRRQIRKANVYHAVDFFLMQFYACRGDGEYDRTMIKNDLGMEVYKEPKDYISELRKTHVLYENIVLSQKYYKKFIKKFLDDKYALIVLDPPYLHETRIHTDSYVFEMTKRQHRYLLQELTKKVYTSKIILCGYNSYMYNHYFDLFNKKQNEVVWHNIKMKKRHNSVIDKSKRKIEHIWINFDVTDLIKNNQDYFEELDIEQEAKRLATKRKRKHIRKASFKNTSSSSLKKKHKKKHKMNYTKLHIKKATFKKVNL